MCCVVWCFYNFGSCTADCCSSSCTQSPDEECDVAVDLFVAAVTGQLSRDPQKCPEAVQSAKKILAKIISQGTDNEKFQLIKKFKDDAEKKCAKLADHDFFKFNDCGPEREARLQHMSGSFVTMRYMRDYLQEEMQKLAKCNDALNESAKISAQSRTNEEWRKERNEAEREREARYWREKREEEEKRKAFLDANPAVAASEAQLAADASKNADEHAREDANRRAREFRQQEEEFARQQRESNERYMRECRDRDAHFEAMAAAARASRSQW